MNTSIFEKCVTGLQHIGIPTNDIEATIAFYEGLGFKTIYRVLNEAANEPVAFLEFGNLVLEIYQNNQAAMKTGAIDHIALDTKNIGILYEEIKNAGYKIISGGINSLPFWERGIRYFIIEGVNAEKIEFCEKL